MKDNQSFMESYLPAASAKSRITKKEWQALNENESTDVGVVSDEVNLSSDFSPALSPCEKPVPWQPVTRIGNREGTFSVRGEEGGEVDEISTLRYTVPLALFSADDKLIVFYNKTPGRDGREYYLDIVSEEIILSLNLRHVQNSRGQDLGYDRSPFTATKMPSVFSHNLVTDLQSITQSEWNSYVMLLPGFFYLPREIYLGQPSHAVGPNAWYMDVTSAGGGSLKNTFYQSGTDTWRERTSFPIYVYSPSAAAYTTRDRFGLSHLGRVFTAGDGVVRCTNYNSLQRTLDTADEYHEANGWATLLTSRAGGETVTGIASYRSHVVVFKKYFMHEVLGTKNPFRASDVGAVGCIDHRSVCEVDGTLFFVSEDGVRVYNGDALPKLISEPLRIREYHRAVAGSFGHKYYLWGTGCQKKGEEESFFYVYDASRGVWTKQQSPAEEIIGFSATSFGFFALGSDGILYKMDSGSYAEQEWFAQTDLWSMENTDVKHMTKAELLLEAEPGASLSVYLLKDGEAFSPEDSRRVFHKTFSEGGQQNVRFHVRKGAFVAAKMVAAGVGKIILRHMKIWTREGGSGHVSTPRE